MANQQNRDDDKKIDRPDQQGDRKSSDQPQRTPQRPEQGGKRDEDQAE